MLATGCVSKPQPAPVSAQTYDLKDNFAGGLGCTPKGDELQLEGTLIVRPFGKGTDGAELRTDSETWILSYRAEGPLLELRDQRVVITGRACDKQGEAIYGKHLDAKRVTVVR